MKKLLILFCAWMIFGVFVLPGEELIELTGSNQNITTVSFELNQFDYILNPLYITLVDKPALFFAMDADAAQFESLSIGDGFRGAWANTGLGFPMAVMLNYWTNASSQTTNPEDSIEVVYNDFDELNGVYTTISETSNVYTKNNESIHNFIAHGVVGLSDSFGLALQVMLNRDIHNIAITNQTSTYSDTNAITAAALTSKGDLTKNSVMLQSNSTNLLALEAEVGLDLGSVVSVVCLGYGMYNSLSGSIAEIMSTEYDNGGVDDTIRDRESITRRSGQYYYDGSVQTSFDMDTNTPNFIQESILSLDSKTEVNLNDSTKIVIPIGLQIGFLAADTQTLHETITRNYDDADPDNRLTDEVTTALLTTYERPLDFGLNVGGRIEKAVKPSERSAFYYGVGLNVAVGLSDDVRERRETQTNRIDGNADGDFVDAGIDTDIQTTQSGWEIQTSRKELTPSFNIPVAVSYSPVAPLTFHAGNRFTIGTNMTWTNSLEAGDSAYYLRTVTDNLEPANSIETVTINGSDNTEDPSNQFSNDFFISNTSAFGFTLDITENFLIDATAKFAKVGFQEFSIMAIYQY